jgi:hypothetical protein
MKSKIFSLKNLIWFCAIGLAVFSGYYSVFGISKLFAGGSWSIIGMAAMLELSKLVVVTFLHDHFKTLRLLFKTYLLSAAVVLMVITSIGVYGYLTNSYQETAKVIYKAQNEITLLDQKKKLFEEQKVQVDKSIEDKNNRLKSLDQIRVSQQNAYTQQLTQKRGTGGLSKNIASVDKSSETINGDISTLTQKSFALSDSIAKIDQTKLTITNESFSSELGPLLYLSRITGVSMDIIVNWFILILVIVFDPLAVSLVIAANHLSSKEKQKKMIDDLSEIGQDTGIGYEKPTQSFPSSINDQITDSVTQAHSHVQSQITDDVTQFTNELNVEPDVIKIMAKETVIDENIEEPTIVVEEPEVELALGDIVDDTPKKEKKKRKSKDLKKSEESSILDESSNEDEERKFYEEEVQPAQLPAVTSTGYSRGISV